MNCIYASIEHTSSKKFIDNIKLFLGRFFKFDATKLALSTLQL